MLGLNWQIKQTCFFELSSRVSFLFSLLSRASRAISELAADSNASYAIFIFIYIILLSFICIPSWEKVKRLLAKIRLLFQVLQVGYCFCITCSLIHLSAFSERALVVYILSKKRIITTPTQLERGVDKWAMNKGTLALVFKSNVHSHRLKSNLLAIYKGFFCLLPRVLYLFCRPHSLRTLPCTSCLSLSLFLAHISLSPSLLLQTIVWFVIEWNRIKWSIVNQSAKGASK